MPTTAEERAVGEVLGLVGDLGGLVLQPIVCLEESAVAILQGLLGSLNLDAVANTVIGVLGPLLAEIKGLLTQVLSIL